MSLPDALSVLGHWINDGLQNVRFSGGEPTLWNGLAVLVATCKAAKVKHIAISTNGSAPLAQYHRLIDAGVNDFSISLDACCAATGSKMAGGANQYHTVVENIRELSKEIYVTVGVVVTEDNVGELQRVLRLADSLGVHDIRVIPAAQSGATVDALGDAPFHLVRKYPILEYRVKNAIKGRGCRGLKETDCRKCGLVLDDSIVSGGLHYPCIIYMREGGNYIGHVSPWMREAREDWYKDHDSWEDPICKANCLDVCIDFNNKRGR